MVSLLLAILKLRYVNCRPAGAMTLHCGIVLGIGPSVQTVFFVYPPMFGDYRC